MDRTEVIVQLYVEERQEARQVEEQRAALTNIIIVALGAGLALVADQAFGFAWLGLALAMVLLGSFGALATRKCFERWYRHHTRAYAYREQLFDLFPAIREGLADFTRSTVTTRKDRYEIEADDRFKIMRSVRLHKIWVAFHVIVVVVGLIFLGIIVLIT